jgi:hypothetical protein
MALHTIQTDAFHLENIPRKNANIFAINCVINTSALSMLQKLVFKGQKYFQKSSEFLLISRAVMNLSASKTNVQKWQTLMPISQFSLISCIFPEKQRSASIC